jgi:hypothetical protein
MDGKLIRNMYQDAYDSRARLLSVYSLFMDPSVLGICPGNVFLTDEVLEQILMDLHIQVSASSSLFQSPSP